MVGVLVADFNSGRKPFAPVATEKLTAPFLAVMIHRNHTDEQRLIDHVWKIHLRLKIVAAENYTVYSIIFGSGIGTMNRPPRF